FMHRHESARPDHSCRKGSSLRMTTTTGTKHVDAVVPRSYSAMSALVLRSLLHLGILQHSLRTGLVAAGDGGVRSHHCGGLDCALRFHGRSRSWLLDRRSAGSALWRSNPISPASLVCM